MFLLSHLGQCFPTFSCSRHSYLVLQIFGGTPNWFNRHKDRGFVTTIGLPVSSLEHTCAPQLGTTAQGKEKKCPIAQSSWFARIHFTFRENEEKFAHNDVNSSASKSWQRLITGFTSITGGFWGIPSRVNFTNILRVAFMREDAKIAKKVSQVKHLFALLGSAQLKAVRKHVDEIRSFRGCPRMTSRTFWFFFDTCELWYGLSLHMRQIGS